MLLAEYLATFNLDCVFGTANQEGKWTTSNCVSNVAGTTIDTAPLIAAATPAKFGSICESDVKTPAPEPTTTAPPKTGD